MALKRLPNDVQSLLCASAQVNSYKKAIEELIYNSIDAKSTSIAIRIHIQESTIQVIDNGSGIAKEDFSAIGQRYMTSKLTDLATLKAAPKNYGYRGEFIANIIMVSQIVKITSRHEKTEETWAKTFIDGKEKKFAQMTTRLTMGTTVDIKGFLYNLNIQKKGTDAMKEMKNIKSFLEQLSLVHNHISLSLRDDDQNEIVFKIHKKRDIYQTLTSLFSIDRLDVIELQVEKLEYKVKGYISKTDKDYDLHWIFLNGKFINYCSKLHKVLSDYFKKYLHLKDQKILKSRKNNGEYRLFDQNIPFYFIFLTCPIIDYNISNTPKQSVIEFKNWQQIDKLLLKLVKFYAGDYNLKEIKNVDDKLMKQEQISTKVIQDTRDQVKKIMDKILGSHLKKSGVSQLQNGIKGKTVKRKVKKKINRTTIIPKLFLQNANKNNNDGNASIKSKAELIIMNKKLFNNEPNNEQQIIQPPVNDSDKKKKTKTLVKPRHRKQKNKIKDPKKYRTKEAPIHTKNREIIGQVSPVKNRYKKAMKQKYTFKKHEKIKVNNNKNQYLEDLDSVCKLSKIVAQKAEFFLHNRIKRRNNIIHMKSANTKDKENNMILKKKRCAINDAIPANTNKYIIEKYIMKKLKSKSYKTTYDLVETVLKSPLELNSAMENNMSEELYRNFYKPNDTLRCVTIAPKRHAWINKYICSEYTTTDCAKKRVSQYINIIPPQFKTFSEYNENFSEYVSIYSQNAISDIMPKFSDNIQFINEEEIMYSQNQNIYCTQKETPYHKSSSPIRVLTYDSHQYHKHEAFTRNETENFYTINKKRNLRFITKESRDNFVTHNDFKTKFKKPYRTISNKQTKTFDTHMRQTIDESHIIEYSKSYDKNCNAERIHKLPSSADFNHDYDKSAITVSYEPINDLNPVLGNTYTVHPSNFNTNAITKNRKERVGKLKLQSTEQIHTYSIYNYDSEVNEDSIETTKDDFTDNNKNFNIVFVSKSQQCSQPSILSCNVNVEPLDVCETVFDEIGSGEKEFAVSFNENNQLNDSLYGNVKDGIKEHIENERTPINRGNNSVSDNVSHHFRCPVKIIQSNRIHNFIDNKLQDPVVKNQDGKTNIDPENFPVHNLNTVNMDCNFENIFNLKNRPRFVPKGMSQIFENGHNRTAWVHDMDKDYYEDSIYNNFANDVQVNAEIYEPVIQNVEDLTTKNIQKFQNKIKKDNASLVFNESSLKEAKVLGQADCKFIVAIMKKRCEQSKEGSEYLILFDQHAVHERIRLEKNLADYLSEERWTSVAIDNIILKMSKDELLYLHNYKDKFTQLGLQWTITNDCEVTIHSIPEAILGKNPREVEKVIKAVKNLIIEEIDIIKSQKGCLSLYPKSIMDLVFSESCRYAIKFGDQLSKSDCVKLIKDISNCKTPFQCAHGRPVIAVIMDILPDKRTYKINSEALRRFKQRNTRKF